MRKPGDSGTGRTWYQQTDLKHMLMPHEDGSIETGANVTLTLAIAALLITNAIEDLAAAIREQTDEG